MSTGLSEPTLRQLRAVLNAEFQPTKLVLSRGVDGVLLLRMLSDAFADQDDPVELLGSALSKAGHCLPERTLTMLHAPSELEPDEVEAFFGCEVGAPVKGTRTWADALVQEPDSDTVPSDDRDFAAPVVAFWGVKGGVGRSTALAHVGSLLAGRGVKVLAVDLDLDAPALVATWTEVLPHDHRPRFDQLVRKALDHSCPDDDLVYEIGRALRYCNQGPAPFQLLGPARADEDFVRQLIGNLSPSVLYRGRHPAMRRLIRLAIKASQADIVLLDARSGYCDESAMAVLDLADQVVLFASPAPSTYESLSPAISALERGRLSIARPSQLHLVVGMLPAGEEARETALQELHDVVERSREELLEALQAGPEQTPAEVDVFALDYSTKIVENDGTLYLNGHTGYHEIAARISVELSRTEVSEEDANWVREVLKETQVPVPQAESEADPEKLTAIFTRTVQLLKFAKPDVCLVLGAKGTGKTYLHRVCLLRPKLLDSSHGLQFVDGYSQPRGGRSAWPSYDSNLLKELHREHAGIWSEIWSALTLGRVVAKLGAEPGWDPKRWVKGPLAEPTLALARAASGAQVVPAVQDMVKQPLYLDELWARLDSVAREQEASVVMLFDDLDTALGTGSTDYEARKVLIRGLLDRVDASWQSRRWLSAKVFLREDLFDSLGTEEAAKYRSRSVQLEWRPEDLWRLAVRAMAVGSARFNERLVETGVRVKSLEDAPQESWSKPLAWLWGERMGTSESATRSTAWAERRLRDGNGRMFPRAVLWLLEQAFEERKRRGLPDDTPLLNAKSLRAAMPTVSAARLKELQAESGDDDITSIQLLKSFASYQDRDRFLSNLCKAGHEGLERAQKRLRRLMELGIVEGGERRDRTPTVRIVDLYAFAPELEVKRLGRR